MFVSNLSFITYSRAFKCPRLKKVAQKSSKKDAHFQSRAKMKNKKVCEKNAAQVAQDFARLFTSATFSSRDIFYV